MMNARNARNAITALVVLASMAAGAITATKEYVDKKDGAISNALETAKTEMQSSLAAASQSATNYTNEAIAAIPPVDLSGYATTNALAGVIASKVDGQTISSGYADIVGEDGLTIRLHHRTANGVTMTAYYTQSGRQASGDHVLVWGACPNVNSTFGGIDYDYYAAVLTAIDDSHVSLKIYIDLRNGDEHCYGAIIDPAVTVEMPMATEVITDFVANLGTDAAQEAIRTAVPQPDLSGYATTNALDAAIANIDLSAKQDALPYATNAIPQAAVSGLATALDGKADIVGSKDGYSTWLVKDDGSGNTLRIQSHGTGGDYFQFTMGEYNMHGWMKFYIPPYEYYYNQGPIPESNWNYLIDNWALTNRLASYATTAALAEVAQSTAANTAALANCVTTETVNQTVTSALNTFTDQKTGVVWTGVMYDGNLYYVAVTNAPSANP